MKTQSRIRLVVGVVSPLILFVSLVSFPLAREGWTTAAMFPDDENTFEFKNDETEDADDLHIEWGRAVTVKDVTPFKKKKGSGTNKTDLSNGVVKKTETASVTVTWQGTEPDVKKWWWTKGDVRLGTVKEGNPTTKTVPVTANLTSGNGLQIATFDIAAGRITVRLPDDMRAGDTISGTVTAEPKGQTPEERAKNKTAMQDNVVAIFAADPTQPKTPPLAICDLSKGLTQPSGSSIVTATFTAPPKVNVGLFLMPNQNSPMGPCGRSGSLVAINESCSPISQLVFKSPDQGITTPPPTTTPTFTIPTLGQNGRPIVITGPFDGKSTNTGIDFQPTVAEATSPRTFHGEWVDFGIIAESPRKAVLTVPSNITGPTQIRVNEGGVQTTGNFRNLKIDLTASKTSLLKGESTELRVEVNGLEGIKEPVPLTLTFTGVITAEGGPYQHFMIQPSQVGADGRYTTTRGITGIQTGGWTATATVVTHKFDVCLQDDTAPARRILWNTFNGDYIFVCPTCWPPKGQPGGTTGETGGKTGGTIPPADPNFPPTDPPGGLTGTGKMIMKGCIITLQHNAPDRRVFARLDACTKTGDASVETTSPKTNVNITDKNTTDNTVPSPPPK